MDKLPLPELLKVWTDVSPHELYRSGEAKSDLLVDFITGGWPDRHIKILEVGCNVGRNLEYLRRAGYKNLTGIEVSPRALDMMKGWFPDLYEMVAFHPGSIEDEIEGYRENSYDVVFSMAVLQHIHPDSEWIFEEIARVAKHGIVTIEDEARHTTTMWPRNYRHIFETEGFLQAHYMNCAEVTGLMHSYHARRFVRPEVMNNGKTNGR